MLSTPRPNAHGQIGPEAPETLAEKNFGLSETEFTHLVEELRGGNERLLEQVHGEMFAYCQGKLVNFDGLNERTAYDVTMDALLHFRELLLLGKVHYGNLRYLFVRVARQLHGKQRRDEEETDPLSDVLVESIQERQQRGRFTEEDFQRLERAFRQLAADCRDLLRQFYFNHRTLRDIAADEQADYTNLRKQKSRCVQRLRSLITY